MNRRFGSLARDSLWTMIGLTAMNGVAQFIIYPYMRAFFGVEVYGKILTMLAIVNVIGVTIGTSLNNARMVAKSRGSGVDNTPYVQFLIVVSAVAFVVAGVVFALIESSFRIVSVLFYGFLIMMTVLKYYSEVEYRLHTNYVGLLVYYVVISIGYLVGIIFVKATGEWMLALLMGETAGFLTVVAFGTIYRRTEKTDRYIGLWKSARYLILAQLMVNLIFNSDRLILMLFCGSSAVSIFYIACAVGKMISLLTGSFNSVIIGYLAKKKDSISVGEFNKLFFGTTGAVFILSVLCLFGSSIYVRLLYPDDYNLAKEYFYLANLGQIFFFASGIFTTILLRYEEEKIQTKVNVVYTFMFLGIAIGASYMWGIWGYTIGILAVNLIRYLYAVYLCKRKFNRHEGGII